MSIDTIVALPAADAVWDDLNPQPGQSVLMAEYDDGVVKQAYLVTGYNAPDWPVSTYIVGAWDNEQINDQGNLQEGQTFDVDGTTVLGTPTHALASDYVAFIRPLGNNAGRATGFLDSLRWQGHSEGKFLADANRYTDTDDPFILTISRDDHTYPDWDSVTTYDTGEMVMHAGTGWASQQIDNLNHEPGQPGSGPWWLAAEFGWGWTATMEVQAASQDPITNYNIRGYPDPACTPGTQMYTSGNFADVGGGVLQTSIPSGNWTPTEEQVNIALIFAGGGNAQTGIITLEVGQDENTSQYWSHDQT
jgi:hypothetical protein